MKRTLLAPVVLLANVALFSGLIAVFVVLYEASPVTLLHRTGPLLLMALFPAVIFTVLRSLFKAIVPTLFLGLLFVTAGLILAGAIFVHHPDGGIDLPDPALERRLPTGVILSGGDVSVRVDDATGVILSDLLVVQHREIPAIHVVPEAMWHAEKSQIVLPDGRFIESEHLSELLWWQVPPAVRQVISDGTALFAILAEPLYAGLAVDTILVWSAFLIALLAVWTPARLFRWPLLNLVVSLAYLRAVLALPSWVQLLVDTYPVPPWVPGLIRNYPAVPGWIIPALLLLVIAILLPSLDRWRREMMEEEGRE